MRGIYPASFEPTFMAIGKVLELSDKIFAGGYILWLLSPSVAAQRTAPTKNLQHKKQALLHTAPTATATATASSPSCFFATCHV